jgi:hypothetical protein
MAHPTTNRAPLIAAVLMLVLPLLYIGSYLALVTPPNHSLIHQSMRVVTSMHPYPLSVDISPYRYGGRVAEVGFWPLEQIDRRVRPGAWEYEWGEPVSLSVSFPLAAPIDGYGK